MPPFINLQNSVPISVCLMDVSCFSCSGLLKCSDSPRKMQFVSHQSSRLTSRQSSRSHYIITISSNALFSLSLFAGDRSSSNSPRHYSVLVQFPCLLVEPSKFMLSFPGALCSSWSCGSPTLGAGATGERASLSLPTQNMTVALVLLLLVSVTCTLFAWLFLVLVTRLY